jgi:molybdopterin converting factor small subunit
VLFLIREGMNITVKLFATLRQGKFDIDTLDLPPGTSVGDIVKNLSIPEEEVTLIFVNGVHGELQTEVKDGDTLALFPPVGGG